MSLRHVLILVILGSNVSPAAAALEARTPESAHLNEREIRQFERIKKLPGVRRAKLVTVDDEVLSNKAFELDMEGKRIRMNGVKSKNEALWKGRSEKGNDRFVIRNIGGKYSGHLLIKGKSYVLTPVKGGVSALYEVSNDFECGIGALEKEEQ